MSLFNYLKLDQIKRILSTKYASKHSGFEEFRRIETDNIDKASEFWNSKTINYKASSSLKLNDKLKGNLLIEKGTCYINGVESQYEGFAFLSTSSDKATSVFIYDKGGHILYRDDTNKGWFRWSKTDLEELFPTKQILYKVIKEKRINTKLKRNITITKRVTYDSQDIAQHRFKIRVP